MNFLAPSHRIIYTLAAGALSATFTCSCQVYHNHPFLRMTTTWEHLWAVSDFIGSASKLDLSL